MGLKDEQILRTAKEVIVKYIEIGRISPQSFPETFRDIYNAINETVRKKHGDSPDNPTTSGGPAD